MTMTALDWKKFYGAERESIGDAWIDRMIETAEVFEISSQKSLIFPHTMLAATGRMTAAAAVRVVRSGCDRVLALGVLHGGREQDAELVNRAKKGDAAALSAARRIHGPLAASDGGLWTDEFSLDNFKYFVERAAVINGHRAPEIIERYPFLTGTDPLSLPGIDELFDLVEQGVPVVATADMVHHGVGYGAPLDESLDEWETDAVAIARSWIEEGIRALAEKDYGRFLQNADRVKSDFRHSGPVLREVLGAFGHEVSEVRLVDYADVLKAGVPTWVAGVMIQLVPNSSHSNFATD